MLLKYDFMKKDLKMILHLFISIISAKEKNDEKIENLIKGDVQILTGSENRGIFYDKIKKIFSTNFLPDVNLGAKTRIENNGNKQYTINIEGSPLCFSTQYKKLILCPPDSYSKGRLWKIKEKEGLYRIKSVKTTGLLFWEQKWCLTLKDYYLIIEKCEKNNKNQLFKIEMFGEKDHEKNKNVGKDLSKEKKNNESEDSDDKSKDEKNQNNNEAKDKSNETSEKSNGLKDEKNENSNNNKRDEFKENKEETLEKENSNEHKKTKIEEELEKIDYKELQNMDKDELLRITGNDRGESEILRKFSQQLNGNESSDSEEDNDKAKDLKSIYGMKKNPMYVNTDDTYNYLLNNTIEKQYVNNFIGGSFGIPGRQFKTIDVLGHSEESRNVKTGSYSTEPYSLSRIDENGRIVVINPMKAAAINLLLEISAFLNGKKTNLCKDSNPEMKNTNNQNSTTNNNKSVSNQGFKNSELLHGPLKGIINTAKELEFEIEREKKAEAKSISGNIIIRQGNYKTNNDEKYIQGNKINGNYKEEENSVSNISPNSQENNNIIEHNNSTSTNKISKVDKNEHLIKDSFDKDKKEIKYDNNSAEKNVSENKQNENDKINKEVKTSNEERQSIEEHNENNLKKDEEINKSNNTEDADINEKDENQKREGSEINKSNNLETPIIDENTEKKIEEAKSNEENKAENSQRSKTILKPEDKPNPPRSKTILKPEDKSNSKNISKKKQKKSKDDSSSSSSSSSDSKKKKKKKKK